MEEFTEVVSDVTLPILQTALSDLSLTELFLLILVCFSIFKFVISLFSKNKFFEEL